jgi:hypothetical protein
VGNFIAIVLASSWSYFLIAFHTPVGENSGLLLRFTLGYFIIAFFIAEIVYHINLEDYMDMRTSMNEEAEKAAENIQKIKAARRR